MWGFHPDGVYLRAFVAEVLEIESIFDDEWFGFLADNFHELWIGNRECNYAETHFASTGIASG